MRTRCRTASIIERAACIILATVFLAAALPKIAAPAEFAATIEPYRLLPAPLVNLAAIYLPWLELLTAVAVAVVPAARKGALLLLIILLVSFTGAQAWALARGLDISCGCFAAWSATPIGWDTLSRNIALLALATAGLMARKTGRK